MRLGQFARKLEVKPSEIAEFLNSEHGLEISVHPNSKIPEALLDSVKEKFYVEENQTVTKNKLEAPIESEKIEIPESTNSPQEEIEEKFVEEKSEEAQIESDETDVQMPELEPPLKEWQRGEFVPDELKEQAETIKAPKIDLEGLKVVGKIELPEKPISESEESTEPKEQKVTRGPKKHGKKTKRKYSKEERDAYAAKKKQKAHEKRLKEQEESRRKEHYQKILENQKNNTKKKKKTRKTAANLQNQKRTEKKPEPTTLWGKFKRWLNDE